MKKDEHLHVLYYNARSILPKHDELQTIVSTRKPDILCIVETWLYEDILDSEVSLQGYKLFRLDRNRHGGGVLMYIDTSLPCKLLVCGGLHELEFIAISISLKSNFCVSLFYQPPSSPVSIYDDLSTPYSL